MPNNDADFDCKHCYPGSRDSKSNLILDELKANANASRSIEKQLLARRPQRLPLLGRWNIHPRRDQLARQ